MSLADHLEKLNVLHEISSSGSLRRAAYKLRLTQPTLSRTIRVLEEELRCALFSRTPAGLVLTEKGRILCEFAGKMLASAAAVEARLRDQSRALKTSVRVGTHESISIYFFPAFLKHLSSVYPNLRATLKTGRSTPIIESLKKGAIDVAITVNPPSSRTVRSVQLFVDRFNFYVAGTCKIRTDTPIILMPDALEMVERLESIVDRTLRGSYPRLECENHETVRALTEEGLGIGLLPEQVAKPSVRRGLISRYVRKNIAVDLAPHQIGLSFLKEAENDLAVQLFRQEIVHFSEVWAV